MTDWGDFPFVNNGRLKNAWLGALHHTVKPVLDRGMGYNHIATSTRYGDTCCASCGAVNTAELVKGTGAPGLFGS